MAGDWIKFSKDTHRKPEVLRLASLLDITPDATVGVLLRFWCWLDDAVVDADVDAVVDGVGALEVDTMMSLTGFSRALDLIGWLRIDESNEFQPRLRVPNFSRHNGETSKKRALKNERQAHWRANHVDAPRSTRPSTREEKRRDTPTNVGVARKAVLQEPSNDHQTLAAELGVSCQTEFEKYRDHFAANGKPHKNEDAGFRNWLRRAAEMRPRVVAGREPTLAEKRAANMAAITGVNSRERTVEGFAERVGVTPFPALPGDIREQGDADVGGCAQKRAYRDVG